METQEELILAILNHLNNSFKATPKNFTSLYDQNMMWFGQAGQTYIRIDNGTFQISTSLVLPFHQDCIISAKDSIMINTLEKYLQTTISTLEDSLNEVKKQLEILHSHSLPLSQIQKHIINDFNLVSENEEEEEKEEKEDHNENLTESKTSINIPTVKLIFDSNNNLAQPTSPISESTPLSAVSDVSDLHTTEEINDGNDSEHTPSGDFDSNSMSDFVDNGSDNGNTMLPPV